MRLWPVEVEGKTYRIAQHDDGTFEMPAELANLKGWNVALKPAQEPIVVARKPLRGTVASNVVTYGTGALNIDACRVETGGERVRGSGNGSATSLYGQVSTSWGNGGNTTPPAGRWPLDFALTHGDCPPDGKCAPGCPVAELDAQSAGTRSEKASASGSGGSHDGTGWRMSAQPIGAVYRDSGAASRFFPTFRYEAKAPTSERPTAVLDGEEVMPETGGRVIAHPT